MIELENINNSPFECLPDDLQLVKTIDGTSFLVAWAVGEFFGDLVKDLDEERQWPPAALFPAQFFQAQILS